MPQGDRTGPMGQGSRTGRALGFCSGYDSPGYTKGFGFGFRLGMGRGMGRGMGFGFRRRRGFGEYSDQFIPGSFHAPFMSKEDEIALLKSQADSLKRSQESIDKRLQELQNQKD